MLLLIYTLVTEIRNSNLTNLELATKFNASVATISKWKNREELADNSSAPKRINYALCCT